MTKAFKIQFQKVTENEVVIEASSKEEALYKFETGDFFGERSIADLGQELVTMEESSDDPVFQLSFGF